MARPAKTGIEYFPFDVDFFNDEKIEPISGEFGSKGEIITIRLLCAVYRNGHFALWDEKLKMTLAAKCKATPELIEQVVSRLVKWGFINESLFNSAKVITSTGIQNRFKEATRKRKYDYENLPFWIKSTANGVIAGINTPASELLPELTTQSKVKESKEEKYTKDGIYPDADFSYQLTPKEYSDTIEFLERMGKGRLSAQQVHDRLMAFKILYFTGKNYYTNTQAILKHFRDWVKFQVKEPDRQSTEPVRANLQFVKK